MLRRLPIESPQPLVMFALARLAVALLAVLVSLVLGLPYPGAALALAGAVLVPWSLGLVLLARRDPELALSPLVAVGDFAILVGIAVAVPETYGAVSSAGLFLVAVHAHFQGERRGLALAAFGSLALVTATAVRGGGPVAGDELAFHGAVFVVAALATAAVVGRLRTTESASRMRARSLSRRTIQSEVEVRRRVAEAIHDGPVQELIGLDMILSAARQATEAGERDRALELVADARELTARNIVVLRDEIVDLGPYAFEELSFATAIENCIPAWRRRYGFEVMATLQALELPREVAGGLFRIAQEAVANAGRHSRADAVSISLRQVAGEVELRIADNGRGFQDGNPLAASQPGHLGLASMRERAELLSGRLAIETSERGTRVLVLAPLREPVG